MAEIDEMIEAMTRIAGAPADAARLAAPLIDEAIKSTVRAGTSPAGTAWAPKKRGGGAPLVHAADAISTAAVGSVVRVTLSGVEVFHHFGAGVPRRQILPDPGTIPPAVARALERATAQAFDRAVG
jgi:hypothetical protein